MKNKYAISNIAWRREDDDNALSGLNLIGMKNLEIVLPRQIEFYEECADYADLYKGFKIIAAQGLMYGSNLNVFKKPKEFENYLVNLINNDPFDCKKYVFGAPRHRKRISFKASEEELFRDTFKNIASKLKKGKKLLIEHVPQLYGANYLTTVGATARMADWIDRPNVGMVWDIGSALIDGSGAGYNLGSIEFYGHEAGHIHISAPGMGTFNSDYLKKCVESIEASTYKGYVTLEMQDVGVAPMLKVVESLMKILKA